jgi:hypothetical protein
LGYCHAIAILVGRKSNRKQTAFICPVGKKASQNKQRLQ